MHRPWLQFYTRDWLDDIALRSCSLPSQAVLVGLMSIAHECEPYGTLTGPDGEALPDEFIASRLSIRPAAFRKAKEELGLRKRIQSTDDGVLFIPRMVRDEEIRRKRAAGGFLGGNPLLTKKVNLTDNQEEKQKDKHAYDSDSVSDSSEDFILKEPKNSAGTFTRWKDLKFQEFWEVCWNRVGKGAAHKAFEKQAHTKSHADRIIEAAKVQGPELVAHAEKHDHSVLHPSTWLNQGRYDDEGVVVEAKSEPEKQEKPLW